MTPKEWEERLHAEGFKRTYVWEDPPLTQYPDHTHDVLTALVILEGEISVTIEGKTRTYKPGDRFDVSPETVHSARMGPQGCRYIIGEE